MAPVRTLAQQRRGYFARPSVGRPDGAVFHPSAWRGEDLSPDRWRVVLTDAELDELGGLADRFLIPQAYNAERFDCDLSAFPTIRRITASCLELEAFRAATPEAQPDAE